MNHSTKRSWDSARFDDTLEDPQTSLVNLVDIMLVFICGLIVALVSAQRQQMSPLSRQQVVQQGRELAELPEGLQGEQSGQGMEPLGQVYRDPKTGKLILIGQ